MCISLSDAGQCGYVTDEFLVLFAFLKVTLIAKYRLLDFRGLNQPPPESKKKMFMVRVIRGEKLDAKPFYTLPGMGYNAFIGRLGEVCEDHRVAYEEAEAAEAAAAAATLTSDYQCQSSPPTTAP